MFESGKIGSQIFLIRQNTDRGRFADLTKYSLTRKCPDSDSVIKTISSIYKQNSRVSIRNDLKILKTDNDNEFPFLYVVLKLLNLKI